MPASGVPLTVTSGTAAPGPPFAPPTLLSTSPRRESRDRRHPARMGYLMGGEALSSMLPTARRQGEHACHGSSILDTSGVRIAS